MSRLWEENKAAANKLDLLGQLDYFGKLSAQLQWRWDPSYRPVRVIHTEAGQPTAALLQSDHVIVDSTLYWVTCKDIQEAHYLLAIINSDALYEAVASLMPKGQFGARHLHKHLWKLPIPEFDPANAAHVALADAGEAAAAGAARELARLRADRERVTVTIARRELRKWLRSSPRRPGGRNRRCQVAGVATTFRHSVIPAHSLPRTRYGAGIQVDPPSRFALGRRLVPLHDPRHGGHRERYDDPAHQLQ